MTSAEDWVDSMDPRLARLQDRYLPREFILDFSGDSFVALEAMLLEFFSDAQILLTNAGRDFVEAAAGYVGEALLRVSGGSWAWDGDHPVARPDPVTGLDAVAPTFLVAECVRRRTGIVLRTIYSTFEQAAAACVAQHRTWVPEKEWTPGVDSQVVQIPSEFLAGWLAEQERSFPNWAAIQGNPETFDFSAESLDALEAALRERLSGVEDIDHPQHHEFLNIASWYYGEVVRRIHGAFWDYNGGEPDPEDPWLGYPYLWQDKNPPHGSVPFFVLQVALRKPGFLRTELARYS